MLSRVRRWQERSESVAMLAASLASPFAAFKAQLGGAEVAVFEPPPQTHWLFFASNKRRRFPPRMQRCITDYMRQEHDEISHLLNALGEELRALPLTRNATETLERLRKLCQKISRVFHTHLEEEEEILYPALEAHVQGLSTTLERMRRDHDLGECAEKVFSENLEFLLAGKANRQGVVEAGRRYIQWIQGHLLSENGRLFPLVERRLDPQTQRELRQAMEELSRQTTAHLVENFPHEVQA
jgi:hemerythrin-like domain-containing protein